MDSNTGRKVPINNDLKNDYKKKLKMNTTMVLTASHPVIILGSANPLLTCSNYALQLNNSGSHLLPMQKKDTTTNTLRTPASNTNEHFCGTG